MIVPSDISRRYSEIEPFLNVLERLVSRTIIPFCRTHRYLFDSRTKALDSVAEKIESGRFSGWDELDDLVAATVVVPTHMHEAGVLRFLETAFRAVEVRARGSTMKPPDAFRFDSTRFIGTVRRREGPLRDSAINGILFEVQIASAFEHAWSMTTHDLVYKASVTDWRRKRLAAQLKAAVEQIDLLIVGFEGSSEVIQASHWPDIAQASALETCLKEKFADGSIPEELLPGDWSRLAENVLGLLRAASRGVRDRERRFQETIGTLSSTLTPAKAGQLPLSCSLFQVVAGIVASAGILGTAPLERYTFAQTADLSRFYPATNGLHPTFRF